MSSFTVSSTSSLSTKQLVTLARRVMLSMRLAAIMGMATLSWRREPMPPRPPRVIAASLPIT